MRRCYVTTLVSFLFCVHPVVSLYSQETEKEYFALPAFKMLSLPQGWFDTTPVYKEPHLLFYSQEVPYTCSACHEKDLVSKPKKSHLPFGAHKDMFFTHGLNLRCLNCHHPSYPDAFTDHDGSVIPQDQPVLLCRKCHGVTFRDWKVGIHGRVNGFWSPGLGPQNRLACDQCHNPHHPKFPALKPMEPPAHPTAHLDHKESHHE